MTDNGNGYNNPPLDRYERRYEGAVYIGVATPELTIRRAVTSVERITRRPGDGEVQWAEFTKGVEAREYHTQRFLASPQFDFILHLDGDMEYPAALLERLRAHGLPCMSGLYFRRTYNPMIPIWFEECGLDVWPMMPFRGVPEPGRLYRLGATGAGCWLIHRSVYNAVEPVLKGEAFWLEDDMDVWPYDLPAVLAGREAIRPLRYSKDRVGADIRLGWFIRHAGHTIWGDAAAACGHYLPYELGLGDWQEQGLQFHRQFAETTTEQLEKLRAEHLANAASVAKGLTR